MSLWHHSQGTTTYATIIAVRNVYINVSLSYIYFLNIYMQKRSHIPPKYNNNNNRPNPANDPPIHPQNKSSHENSSSNNNNNNNNTHTHNSIT